MDGERRRRGDLERYVLATLAEAGQPLTAAQVRQRLGAELAYTTVMTVLTRLAAKGLIDRSRQARRYVYRASADSAEVTARRMQRLLDADVHLALWVQVRSGWADDERHLRTYGFG